MASGSAPAQALASCQCGRNRHGFTTPTSFAATATSSLTRASDVLPRPRRPRAGNGSHAIAESSPKEVTRARGHHGLGVMSPLSFSRGMGPLTGPVMSSLIHSRQVEALGDLGLELFDIDAVEP